jgi:glycine cleavage system aminomethyltransferase T/glycine/D-amino acid oxidase-like deaminating enzyme
MVRPRDVPDRARVVIVGGGVGGAAVAHHLAKLGERDVVLLERSELTSGSTFHSAGLVGQLRSSVSLTRLMMDSVELYRTLDCGWVQCGGVRLACTAQREEEVLRQVAWARTFGLPLELISAEQARELFPLMSTDGVRCGSYLASDGYLDPSLLTTALVDGARAGGCRVFTHTRVTGIDVQRGTGARPRVRGVQTEWGPIEAEVVVNAGGMFAAEIGRMAGVRVPIVPFAHEYLVTQPFRERAADDHLPTLRDPDLLIYFREEGAGLVMGGYERHSAPWSLDEHLRDAIPHDFNGRLLEEDWPRFEEIAANSSKRVPAMDEITVTRLINGPEAFTPDNEFCLGESEVAGLFVAAGFCAHGLAGAGGLGQVIAEWILAGEPTSDVWEMDIRRFGAQYRSPSYTLKRAREVYETYYDIRYPGHEREAGRPLRVSSAYGWHAEHGAAFGEKSGWERVNWYESNAGDGDEALRPRGWAGMHWSPAIGAEHRATRERAGLFDESSFAKLEIAGPGAADFLERLCDNEVARDVGAITYTQMLNARGGIECDFTVTRVEEELFSIVTGTAFGNHDLSWIRRHTPDDGSVRLADVTSRWSCFALWGPRAREILSPLTDDPLDFAYMQMGELAVGDVPVRALRVTFVGEHGWELYCPSEYGAGLWRALWDAGREHGLVAGGYRAIDSMRLEKGYRVWAADITADESPFEAGLGFCVKKSRGDFNGAAALGIAPDGRRTGDAPDRRLRCIVLEDPRSVALGNEPVRVENEIVGRVTSGGYGYTVARSIAYAYVPAELDFGAAVEIDIFGRWVAGEIVSEPLFDPKGERVRGTAELAR